MEKKNVNSQVAFNFISTSLLMGVNFFTTPVFTRLLDPAQYGKYNVFSSWATILLPVVCLETYSCIGLGKHDYENEYSKFIRNIFIFGCSSSLLFLVIGVFFSKKLSALLGFSKNIFIVMLAFSIAQYIVEFIKSVFTYEKKAGSNLIISAVLVILSSILSVILIKYVRFGELFEGRAYGASIPYFIVALIGIIVVITKTKGSIDFSIWKYSFLYGYPIVFHQLSHSALGQANKLLLEYLGYAGVTVGVYSFFQVFSSVVSTVLFAFNNSWVPFYYDDLNNKNFNNLSIRVRNYIELFTVISIGFVLLSREVCVFFAPKEYMSGINLIPLFVCITYLTFMYQFPVNFEYYNKKTKLITAGTIIAGICNIFLNYILVPIYGMYGAAMSSLISYLLLFIVHFLMAKRIREMRFHVSLKDFAIPVCFLLASIFMFYILKDLWFIRWTVGAAIGMYELLKIIKRKAIF